MDKSELLDNIRSDFFTEVCPFFKPSYFTDYDAISKALSSVVFISNVLSKEVFYKCATIVQRNAIEFSLVNIQHKRKKKVTFDDRVNFRFISSFSASMLTAMVLKRSHNPFTVIVVPSINGAISVVFLFMENPEKASQYFHNNYPNAIKFLEEKCYLNEIKLAVKEFNNFVNGARMEIHDD